MNKPKPKRVLIAILEVLMLSCIAIGGAGLLSFIMAIDPMQAIAGLIGGTICLAIGIYGLQALKAQALKATRKEE